MTEQERNRPVERALEAIGHPVTRFLVRGLMPRGEAMVDLFDELGYRYIDRGNKWLDDLSQRAGMSKDQLVNRALEDEQLTEVVASAFRAAVSSPDSGKRRLLARTLVPALTDDAKIDAAAFLVRRIASLEPVHVRVLGVLAERRTEPYDRSERSRGVVDGWPEPLVVERLRSEPAIVEMILLDLQALGLAVTGAVGFSAPTGGGVRPWRITAAGREILVELSGD